jgi:predicted GNAT family N-acyltransferase
VTDPRFRFEELSSAHDRRTFNCGVEPLDRYLRQQASQDVRNNVATVIVMVESATSSVAGYYTLCSASIALSTLPAEIAQKLPRYPVQPAILLGRLALDLRFRGQQLGELLLLNALKRSLALSKMLASMSVVVDAKDDRARLFYERNGFQRLADDHDRLVISMKNIGQL